MADLKIPEVILRERRKKNLTQEELAASLGVSSQAISNWERGGYPDITLLPRIANFFGITVDELIGNDEVSKQEDIESFKKRYERDSPKGLALAKEYYARYPNDFDIMELLIFAIYYNRDTREENYPLLKEVCERIVNECTWEYVRMNAISFMCSACPDEEWDKWRQMCARNYGCCENEMLEERYLERGQAEKFYDQRNKNDLLIFMHGLGRIDFEYYTANSGIILGEPERTAAWEKHKIALLESLEDEIPEAWLGYTAECWLKMGGALIGCGRSDEGFAALERSFAFMERWAEIPGGAMMDLGCREIWGGAKIAKNDSYVKYPDGSEMWTPTVWLFWQLPGDIHSGMTKWPWFDNVKDDPRYLTLLERAEKLGGIA